MMKATRWANHPYQITKQLSPMVEQVTDPTNIDLIFDYADKFIEQNSGTIGTIIRTIDPFMEANGTRALEFVERALMTDDEWHVQRDLYEVIASKLPAIAKIDVDYAFQLMEELYAYRGPVIEIKPPPPGVIHAAPLGPRDEYMSVRKGVVAQIGKMAKFDEERAFTFAENLIAQQKQLWKWELTYTQIPLLAEINFERALCICETLSGDNSGHAWRSFSNSLAAFSRQRKSERVWKMVDRLITHGDHESRHYLARELENFENVPPGRMSKWGQRLHTKFSRLGRYMGPDSAKDSVARVTDGPSQQARVRMEATLNKMGLSF